MRLIGYTRGDEESRQEQRVEIQEWASTGWAGPHEVVRVFGDEVEIDHNGPPRQTRYDPELAMALWSVNSGGADGLVVSCPESLGDMAHQEYAVRLCDGPIFVVGRPPLSNAGHNLCPTRSYVRDLLIGFELFQEWLDAFGPGAPSYPPSEDSQS